LDEVYGSEAQTASEPFAFSGTFQPKEKHHEAHQARSQGRQEGPQGFEDSRRIQGHFPQEEPEALMATMPQPVPQQGAPQPPQGGGKAPSGAVVQVLMQLAKLSQVLGQVFPAASEESDGIQKLVQSVQSKVSATTSPSQPQAPPI
jgi:hypothetical protein